MRRFAIIGAAVAALASGCVNYIETVHVRVKDPAAVGVAIDTPHGRESLIAPNTRFTSAPIPPTTPPYLEAEQNGASVVRYGSDTLAAKCDWCSGAPSRSLVTADGRIDLLGAPVHVLTRSGDELRMRFDYEAPLPCHRRHGSCDRPAFAVSLETPRANILDLHFERRVSTAYGELTGAKLGIGAGVLATALGIAAISLAITTSGSGRLPVATGGVAALAIGGLFIWTGVATLRAEDTDTPLATP